MWRFKGAKNLSQEVIVDKIYRSILGREGEDDEKNYWLRHGDALIQIVVKGIAGRMLEFNERNLSLQKSSAFGFPFRATTITLWVSKWHNRHITKHMFL